MEKAIIKIGIIGYGYWGPNLVRNFNGIKDCKVTCVSDLIELRLDVLSQTYHDIQRYRNMLDIINSPDVDAVVVATPVFTHYDIALKALHAGKHVLIEKPMVSTSQQALELIELAERKNLILMVDHTFLYTGAIQKMKELISNGEIGDIKYIDSTRINLGLFQPDVNVLWDLAPHDISIVNYLHDEKPHSVQATGISHTGNNVENIAYLTVNYKSGFIAHFNCSWTSPVKIRLMLIGGDKKMIVFNDLEPTEKLKIYETSYQHQSLEDNYKIQVDYRTGDIYIPKLTMKEALGGMASDFLKAIISNTKPISDYNSGLEVVKILEASQESIKNRGKEIIIK